MQAIDNPMVLFGVALRRLGTLPPAVWSFFGLLAATILAFTAAPWPAAAKFRAVVHGLCAQRPSHSYALGGIDLPFDARMTGIYGGALVCLIFLLARGRGCAVRLPAPTILAALGLFIALLGLDGINSTLQDFGLPYLYEPRNDIRLLTGLLMGVTLGVALTYMINLTLWARFSAAPILADWREFATLLALCGGAFLLIASGWGWLYLPLALALVGGATLVVLILALTTLTLLRGQENRAERLRDVAGSASVALLIGYVVMAAIALGRWYLERSLGVPLPL
jgi:uncharacterized membrane protein